MNKVPVGKTIVYAYAFTFGHLGTVIGLTWFAALLTAGLSYTSVTIMNPANFDAAALRVDPALAFQGLGSYLLCLIGMIFAGAVIAVALVRQALGLRTGVATIHFAAGTAEWRMFGAHLRFIAAAIGIVIIFYVGVIVIGLIGRGVTGIAQQSPALGGIAGIAILVATVALMVATIATLIRMGFFLSPTVVAERPGGIQRSFALSKGNVWRIFFVWLGVALPLMIVLGVAEYFILVRGLQFDFSNLPTDTGQWSVEFTRRVNEWTRAFNANMMQNLIPLEVVTFASTILYSSLTYSAAAFAYRALVPPAPQAPAAPAPSPPLPLPANPPAPPPTTPPETPPGPMRPMRP